MRRSRLAVAFVAALAFAVPGAGVLAHGDVTPQPVDTAGLAPLGETWREANPYRGDDIAVRIGSSGYNQNCGRCHGLEAISCGLARDPRCLDMGREGDEW